MVRPEHPITKHAMASRGEEAKRLPLCSDLLHAWAMNLVSGNPVGLTKMDPLSSPDLLFPMPDRAKKEKELHIGSILLRKEKRGDLRQHPEIVPRKERQLSPTPTKDRSHRSKKRSPSPRRDRSSEERQRSPTPPKERSHHRRRHSPSPVRERPSEEHRHSPASTKEHCHGRRRRSPTPTHDRSPEERKPSPPTSREPSRERRRRRRSPEPSEVSREERRRSPSPKGVPPESPRVSSKKSKKSGKKEKKEKDSKGSRRTGPVENVEDRTTRDERSRSTRRPESSRAQPTQAVSVEESETDDHPTKDDRPVATQDRPAKPRPRFDPSREHAVAQRIMDKRRVVQPPREHGRDPGTDGPPDTEDEVKQRRRYPPPPPPASSTRQPQTSHRSLAFANPPPRRDSATESSRISDRQPLRIRSQETPPQRPMPKRVLATSTVSSSAPPGPQDMSGRAHRGEYYDPSQKSRISKMLYFPGKSRFQEYVVFSKTSNMQFLPEATPFQKQIRKCKI